MHQWRIRSDASAIRDLPASNSATVPLRNLGSPTLPLRTQEARDGRGASMPGSWAQARPTCPHLSSPFPSTSAYQRCLSTVPRYLRCASHRLSSSVWRCWLLVRPFLLVQLCFGTPLLETSRTLRMDSFSYSTMPNFLFARLGHKAPSLIQQKRHFRRHPGGPHIPQTPLRLLILGICV